MVKLSNCLFFIVNPYAKDSRQLKETLSLIYGKSKVRCLNEWSEKVGKELMGFKGNECILLFSVEKRRDGSMTSNHDVKTNINRSSDILARQKENEEEEEDDDDDDVKDVKEEESFVQSRLKIMKSISSDQNLRHVSIVSTSKVVDHDLMFDCVRSGAVDHVMLPISKSQAKTLWLQTMKKSTMSDTKEQYSEKTQLNGLSKLMNGYLKSSFPIENQLTRKPLNHKKYSEMIKNWDFDATLMSEEETLECALVIFEQLNVIQKLNLNKDKIRNFVTSVKENYKNPKYHNFNHAVDVLQCFYYFLVNSSVVKYLKEIEIFSLAISALCHDIAHPGLNNSFQINTRSELAILYNNNSVLENFHSSATFCLLSQKDLNFLSDLSASDSKVFRDIVTSSILSTDMALHSDFIKTIKSKLSSGSFSVENHSDALFLASSFLKCADISNVARPFEISIKWMKLLLEECRHQGQMEKEMGIGMNPFSVEGYNEIEGQIGFINHVVKPLFELMSSLISPGSCSKTSPLPPSPPSPSSSSSPSPSLSHSRPQSPLVAVFLNPFHHPLSTINNNLVIWNKIKANPSLSPLPSLSSSSLIRRKMSKEKILTESEFIHMRRNSLPQSLSPLDFSQSSINGKKVDQTRKIHTRTRSLSIFTSLEEEKY